VPKSCSPLTTSVPTGIPVAEAIGGMELAQIAQERRRQNAAKRSAGVPSQLPWKNTCYVLVIIDLIYIGTFRGRHPDRKDEFKFVPGTILSILSMLVGGIVHRKRGKVGGAWSGFLMCLPVATEACFFPGVADESGMVLYMFLVALVVSPMHYLIFKQSSTVARA